MRLFQTGKKYPVLIFIPPFLGIYGLIVLFFLILLIGIWWWKKRRKESKKKYFTSGLGPKKAVEIQKELVRLMDEDEIYLDSEMTLTRMADMLNIHYNHLSQIINEKIGLSFNDFINRHRVEKMKLLLGEPANTGTTILDLAYEVGFSSKSVFNTAFKKFTGLTPRQYRKQALSSYTQTESI